MAVIESTAVRVRVVNKKRLEALKIHPRETVDDVLTKLLDERERERREEPKPAVRRRAS